ncbi:uncharacterized protein [Typha angustifolia]|uniref:uncharacterized protein n=1 Tax=Typha angustifolia TaxID=59011 RepID=UPI003C2EEC06
MEPSNECPINLSTSLGLQQLPSSSNNQATQIQLQPMNHTSLPVTWGSQQLQLADKSIAQSNFESSIPANVRSYDLLSMNRQPLQMGAVHARPPFPGFFGLHQLASLNRRPLGTELLLNIQTSVPMYLGAQPSPSTSKRPTYIEASHKFQSPKAGLVPLSNNRTLQMEPSTKAGLMPLSNKRTLQMEPSPKIPEPFESVRSKLRESLAASLATVSDQQSKLQESEKSSLSKVASTKAQVEVATQLDESRSISANACGTSTETLSSNEPVLKCNLDHNLTSNMGSTESTRNGAKLSEQDFQAKLVSSEGEVPSSIVAKDELLQGHGLCWASDLDSECAEAVREHDPKRLKTAHEGGDIKDPKEGAKSLAFKIEEHLFRLFGGVNKKYKEKARSLLFNLKDRSNPELRERVLSGDIAPQRLCTMTAEDLASKELSQWRLAKAEELAQMVVLPDSDVDIRRLVRKTHKGEFQVEVEYSDDVSVEVELGASILSQVPSKSNGAVRVKSKSNDRTSPGLSKPGVSKASEGMLHVGKADSGDCVQPSNFGALGNEKADLMQELMEDELKDTVSLSPIVSLDEFMEALDSEPPFENLTVDNSLQVADSGEKNVDSLESEVISASEFSEPEPIPASDGSKSKIDFSHDVLDSKLHLRDTALKDPITIVGPDKMDTKKAKTNNDLISDSAHVQSLPEAVLACDSIWEGVIQLNVSSLATVVGFFRSGEKLSTREWPSLLEIKGRVRIDAFEKFLHELPLSRNRAIMIVQFCWKEGSPESGRLHLSETVESYIADDRVGFAEPAPGVELYFCPPHSKTCEMLHRFLPKEHSEALHSSMDGLIGMVVWRRSHVTMSPRMSSHHKHSSTKKQFSARKQHSIISNSSSRSSYPVRAAPIYPNLPSKQDANDDDDDDVPPGFGPANARDEDDLPEFDFVNSSKGPTPTSQVSVSRSRVAPSAHPMDQMRELIHKYGQGGNVKRSTIDVRPWNDEDDDIPEWHPDQHNQKQAQSVPPLQPLHTYPAVKPFQVNQHLISMPNAGLPLQPPASAFPAVPMPFQPPLPPPSGVMAGSLSAYPGGQPNPWWSASGGQIDVGLPMAGSMQPTHFSAQPNNVQLYGVPNPGPIQNGMGWRPDPSRSRGV